MSPQFQQEALAEYEAKMKVLEAEVKEAVSACFPSEAEEASREPCEQDLLTAKEDTEESRL